MAKIGQNLKISEKSPIFQNCLNWQKKIFLNSRLYKFSEIVEIFSIICNCKNWEKKFLISTQITIKFQKSQKMLIFQIFKNAEIFHKIYKLQKIRMYSTNFRKISEIALIFRGISVLL